MKTSMIDYLRKKGLLPKEELMIKNLFIVHSTREMVSLKEMLVWDIKVGGTKLHFTDNNTIIKIPSKRFFVKESPYEIDIYDGEEYGENHGCGTGCGDLWSWSYYAFTDRKKADSMVIIENERILKYK